MQLTTPSDTGSMAATRQFSELLRELRIGAGLTQEELAEASGVSRRAISDLERGRAESPQRRSAEALAEALPLDCSGRSEFLRAASLGRRLRTMQRLPSNESMSPAPVADEPTARTRPATPAGAAVRIEPATVAPMCQTCAAPTGPPTNAATPAVVVLLTAQNDDYAHSGLARQLADVVRSYFVVTDKGAYVEDSVSGNLRAGVSHSHPGTAA